MMKKWMLLSLLVFAGCAGSSVKEGDEAGSTSAPNEVNEEAVAPIDKPIPSEVRREEKIPASQYGALNDAIKRQSDEGIQKAAAEILTQNSKDLKALNSLAMVYYRRSKFEAANYLLTKALAAHPASGELYGNRGLVLLAKDEKREAIQSFRKALELNPKDGTTGSNLGSIYVLEKDYNKALLALEVATKNGVRDQKTMTNYALALTGTGKTKEAAEVYEKILKDNPSQKEAMLNYSILLIEDMKKYKEGLDLLSRLKFVGDSVQSRQVIKELEIKAKAGLQ